MAFNLLQKLHPSLFFVFSVEGVCFIFFYFFHFCLGISEADASVDNGIGVAAVSVAVTSTMGHFVSFHVFMTAVKTADFLQQSHY